MTTREFFGKLFSPLLLLNLLAMALVVAALGVGVKFGLEWYTHHGEGIEVPKVEGMVYREAFVLMTEKGLNVMVADSGYNKKLPPNCVLAQNPGPGVQVKEGHTVYVTLNAPSSPTYPIPDVVDNSSYREAEAKLTAMGFRLLPPKYVTGEKDWVYGIISRGRRVNAGEMVTIDSPLTLVIGSGMYDQEEEIDYVDSEYDQQDDFDDFEEISEP